MHLNQELMKGQNIYTAVRQKKWPAGITTSIVRLTLDQAKQKTTLLSRFITDRWGSGSPVLGESIDQEAVEAYEAFIDPYIQSNMPVPAYEPKSAIAVIAPLGSKVCKACRQDKPVSDYYSHPKTKDRRQPVCKGCQKVLAGARKLKTLDSIS
jgi:hypothetical protein